MALDSRAAAWEARTALKFAAVGLLGLATDAALLRLGVGLGLSPAVARLISLFFAMQVTFVVNGVQVFRCLDRAHWPRQWAGYMLANGAGNFCNYWLFVTLISLHEPVVSNRYVALVAGSFAAYLINYCGTRLLVFGKGRTAALQAMRRKAKSDICGPPEPTEFAGPAVANRRVSAAR
ncbi:MAG TPA: GtrA family protein [Caulobacteraceae bacterium]